MSRGAHESRQGRKRKAKRQEVNTDTETEASAADDDENEASTPKIEHSKLGRIKRSFIRKVLSPLIGYGMDYDLLHFIYDLSMWTTVGAKKNVARQTEVPLRVVLRSCPWTPQYWHTRHLAVIDMQRQCGNATLFPTDNLFSSFVSFCYFAFLPSFASAFIALGGSASFFGCSSLVAFFSCVFNKSPNMQEIKRSKKAS